MYTRYSDDDYDESTNMKMKNPTFENIGLAVL